MKKWYYYYVDGVTKIFFESSEELLNVLKQNDEMECGAKEMTEDEFKKLKEFNG